MDAHDQEPPTRSIDWTTVAASAAMVAVVAMRAGSRETEVQEKDNKQVWVRTPAGTTAAVQIQDDDTTESLQIKVAQHLSIPPKTPRLIFGGRQLREQELLGRQGVEHGSTVHVVFTATTGAGTWGRH